ncbi:hypothetical protein [Clostridium sp. C8-1-8]|nr:hypothetical protein [Clostridium sp. C8-1-8]
MRKKLSTIMLSVLVLGILAIPVNNITPTNGGHIFHTLIDWVDPI